MIFTEIFSLPIFAMALALLLDRLIGEPYLHPLVWFGKLATRLELKLNSHSSVARGVISTLLLVVPATAVIAWAADVLAGHSFSSMIFDAVLLWFAIGWQSMQQHAVAVLHPLEQSNLAAAKDNVAMIVSRDTADMDSQQISVATVESVLENGNDCLFASLFWFAVAGSAGAIAHRLVNTLDAMWGDRSERYNRFGRFAARLDDVMGYIPARLTALSYALVGDTRRAIACWRHQARRHPSPNAGVVMASGAGALGIELGGAAIYHGVRRSRGRLGDGPVAEPADIRRAIRLGNSALVVWLIAFALWAWVSYADS